MKLLQGGRCLPLGWAVDAASAAAGGVEGASDKHLDAGECSVQQLLRDLARDSACIAWSCAAPAAAGDASTSLGADPRVVRLSAPPSACATASTGSVVVEGTAGQHGVSRPCKVLWMGGADPPECSEGK